MKSFLKSSIANPIVQLALILVLMLVFMTINYMIQSSMSEDAIKFTSSWEIMATFVLFFSLVNCVFSLQSKDIMIYWRNSIFSFAALLLIGGLLSYAFTGIGIYDAGSISWILTVFAIGYLIFLSIVNLMRFIVDLAQKQDAALRGEDELK